MWQRIKRMSSGETWTLKLSRITKRQSPEIFDRYKSGLAQLKMFLLWSITHELNSTMIQWQLKREVVGNHSLSLSLICWFDIRYPVFPSIKFKYWHGELLSIIDIWAKVKHIVSQQLKKYKNYSSVSLKLSLKIIPNMTRTRKNLEWNYDYTDYLEWWCWCDVNVSEFWTSANKDYLESRTMFYLYPVAPLLCSRHTCATIENENELDGTRKGFNFVFVMTTTPTATSQKVRKFIFIHSLFNFYFQF